MDEKPAVPYHPTSFDKAEDMLNAAGLRKEQTIYDIGCGEGNILIVGAERFGARGIGIEIDPELVEKARKNIKERGLDNIITIVQGDLFDSRFWAHVDGDIDKPYAIKNADVLALYLNFPVLDAVVPMLEKELEEGTVIVSYEFFIRGWKEVREGPPMIFIFEAGKSY